MSTDTIHSEIWPPLEWCFLVLNLQLQQSDNSTLKTHLIMNEFVWKKKETLCTVHLSIIMTISDKGWHKVKATIKHYPQCLQKLHQLSILFQCHFVPKNKNNKFYYWLKKKKKSLQKHEFASSADSYIHEKVSAFKCTLKLQPFPPPSSPSQHSSTTVPAAEYSFFLMSLNPGRSLSALRVPGGKHVPMRKKSRRLGQPPPSCLKTNVNSKVGTTLESQASLSSLSQRCCCSSSSRCTSSTQPRNPHGSPAANLSISRATRRVRVSGTSKWAHCSLLALALDRQPSSSRASCWHVCSSHTSAPR